MTENSPELTPAQKRLENARLSFAVDASKAQLDIDSGQPAIGCSRLNDAADRLMDAAVEEAKQGAIGHTDALVVGALQDIRDSRVRNRQCAPFKSPKKLDI